MLCSMLYLFHLGELAELVLKSTAAISRSGQASLLLDLDITVTAQAPRCLVQVASECLAVVTRWCFQVAVCRTVPEAVPHLPIHPPTITYLDMLSTHPPHPTPQPLTGPPGLVRVGPISSKCSDSEGLGSAASAWGIVVH